MKNEVAMKPFPENLFTDLGYPAPEKEADDFIGTFMYVLYQVAPPRDVKVFILRYRNRKSCEEIAEALDISRQRVHAVLLEVLGRITHDHAEMMAKGMKRYMEDLLEQRAESIASTLGEADLAVARAEAYAEGLRVGMAEATGRGEPEAVAPKTESTGVVLESLGLTTRTYNACKKNDLLTLEDILRTGDGIMNCRSFGVNAFHELMSVLRTFGVNPEDYYPETIQRCGAEA